MTLRSIILATAAFASVIPASVAALQGFAVYGAIRDKWIQLGGATGPLGPPLSSEADAARGGRFNAFRNGYIYWHPSFSAHAVYGLIGQKWNALGRERNFGYPLTDERAGPRGGRYNDFENNATITWQAQAGTHSVYGFIRDAWIKKGREGGNCKYPIRDEYDFEGGRRTDFQEGFITWRRGARAAVAHCSEPIDPGTALNPVSE